MHLWSVIIAVVGYKEISSISLQKYFQWAELEGKFADNAKAAVFDIDCTADAFKPVCQEHGVRGYPTIKGCAAFIYFQQ